MSVLRHSLWAASSAVLIMASRFFLTAILARRLGVAAFGQYVYFQWLIDFGFLVCALGATGVASRYFAEYRHQPPMLVAIVRYWRPFSLGLPFAGALAACAGAWLSGISLGAGGYTFLLCWGFTTGLWNMHAAALIGLQRFDLVLLGNVLAFSIMLTGAALMPLEGGGLLMVFAIMSGAAAVASTVGVRAIASVAQGVGAVLSVSQGRAIFRYAINIWLTTLLSSLAWSRGEVPVLRGLLGDGAVAQYAVALSIYGGAVAGVMLGVSGIGPQITRYWGEGKQEAAIRLCRKAMDLQLLLSGLGALALIWLAPELMVFGFGEKYSDSAVLLSVLALGLPPLTMASHSHLLQLITGARYNRNTTLLGVILLLGLSWTGVQAFGVPGAAWSRAMTLLVLGGITFLVCWRRWGGAALGAINVALVISISILSVLCSLLQMFDTLPVRIVAWLVLSLVMMAFVKSESKKSVAIDVMNMLWRRIRLGG